MLLLALLVAQPAPAVADRVFLRGPDGAVTSLFAEVKETPAGLQLLAGGKTTTHSPADVVRIDYTDLPGVTRLDLQKAQGFEDGRDPARAVAEFADLGKRAGANDRTRRYAQFREGYWLAKVADGKPWDEFPAAAAPAVARLEGVARAGKKGWECWPAGRLAARLYGELGEFTKAAAVYAELANAELPKELKAEARLDEAAAHLRAGRKAEAADALAKADGGLLAERRAVLTAAVAGDPIKLQSAIDSATDPAAKAVGHNLLADVLQAAGKPKEAMWSRLWVDAVYPQAADERVLAVRALAAGFTAAGDADRAERFRGRLREARGG